MKKRAFFLRIAIMMLFVFAVGNVCAENNSSAETEGSTTGRKKIKILGIGNSFLANVMNSFPGIVKNAGHELIVCKAIPGGHSLQMHYDKAMINEENPEDPKGKPYKYNDKKMSLKEVLVADKWDYVTIQQSSPNSYKIETYRPYAKNLCDYIKKHAPQAEIVLHQTWAWRPDHTRQGMDKKGEWFMYRELTKAYYTIAKELGLRIIPVGNAFQLAAESPEWKFERDPNFNYENPKYPELPNEKNSLNGGFAWRKKGSGDDEAPAEPKKKDLDGDPKDFEFKLDGSHASAAGSYLAGCVWFEFFYKDDVRKVKRNPGFLKDRAESLREIAHKVVSEGIRPKEWPKEIEP
ncbi:MAG TPA: DUF4886 domain-containing protein [Victivallales bacterium]|nr:DUF4886 domain-containing protein [Victivallales bacterium]